MIDRKQAIAGALLVALVAGLAGFVVGHRGLLPVPGGRAAPPAEWQQLELVRSYIKSHFVEPVPDARLIEGALRGLVESTGDAYSVYLNRNRYTQFLESLNDSFSGIGVQVEYRDNFVTVVSPLKDTPGARAGLRRGDRVVAVDGRNVTHLHLDEVVSLIRGPAGTQVRLTIEREQRKFDVNLTRAHIPLPQIDWRMLETQPKIGYVQLYQFNTGLGERLQEAIAALRSQGMQGLILDLRGNPGGLLSEAVNVASVFLPPGPVVHVVDRKGVRQTYNSQGTGFDLPLVVLVDGDSASAAEIVAGALKDREQAILVGTRTFGKASVQNMFELPDGSGLKLTIARYLTADGQSIHETGIAPDVVVEVDPELALPLNDLRHPQLKQAVEIIRQRLR